ncbi:MAG: hypothetical protein DRJ41_04450 [Thermoprotei archaeon]|nr:MAG: hypothetical protein DRJ41_04450 [Thermoprotei archaeon]
MVMLVKREVREVPPSNIQVGMARVKRTGAYTFEITLPVRVTPSFKPRPPVRPIIPPRRPPVIPHEEVRRRIEEAIRRWRERYARPRPA